MDRFQRTADIIKSLYEYKKNGNNAEFVSRVCGYFDEIKTEKINSDDLNFLSLIANEAGIPQYYDMLLRRRGINEEECVSDISLGMLGSYFYDASLTVKDGSGKLHRFQKSILDRFNHESRNRFVLTAPTSFGKTFIVYQIINKLRYKNVLLIFPTISLLTENYEKIKRSEIFTDYKVHTLSESDYSQEECNIFVFTPERYLSFLDSHRGVRIDFAFIDEVYKIDNGYLIDDTVAENERDVAYRLALEYICKNSKDILLAGPYISIEKGNEYNSFRAFCEKNAFSILLFNEYEIVNRNYYVIEKKGRYSIDGVDIIIPDATLNSRIKHVVLALSKPSENTIVYCGRKTDAENYPKEFLADNIALNHISSLYKERKDAVYDMFVRHLEETYGEDWIVVSALKARIGIHHGLIPKYIQKEIINLFNKGELLCLFSTTTITEGVNTPAKNMVITSLKKGKKGLKQFDAKNIAGRAGRFGEHYSGRVIDIRKGFEEIIEDDNDKLKHKNYDYDMPKSDVDFQITEDSYLNDDERLLKKELQKKVEELHLPKEVFNSFKVVGPQKKIALFEAIQNMSYESKQSINNLIDTVVNSRGYQLDWAGLQTIIDIIIPIVSDAQLLSMLNQRIVTINGDEYSLLIILLDAYLKQGFMGMVKYRIEKKKENINTAMRSVASTVYNVFKYQLVKYLGAFDAMYRYAMSVEKQCDIDKVNGLSFLLQKLEYNAVNSKAKLVSDYGVPFNLVSKYDHPGASITLDEYEQYIDVQVKRLLE